VSASSSEAVGAPEPSGDPRLELLLALGDDELVVGHRHSHWAGVAPHLEEDLALSSIAQDEIGHAAVWYEIAAAHFPDAVRGLAVHADPSDDALDVLSLGRPPEQYRHAIVCERPPGDWAYTLARQHVYDTVDVVRLTSLAGSAWAPLAEATGPLRREERYHLAHARAWVPRVARAGSEARQRLVAAYDAVLAEAGGMLEALPGEDRLLADGVLPEPHATLAERAGERLAAALAAAGLDGLVSGALAGGLGGRRGVHTEDFTAMWEEMTATYRAHPGARW
jgi:ring-1,2-phenylacetyl-CoA epoxidase subunit PaaC